MQSHSAESGSETIQLDESRVTWREVDGEVVAVDVNTAEYLTTNGSGAVLWGALSSGATEQELADTLVDTYEISSEQAATDVDLFLRTLRDRGLVNCVA